MREIVIQICHRLLPRLLIKQTNKPVRQEIEEEARIYEIVGWIDVTSNHEHFLWLSLRMVNFCERNGFYPGVVMAFTGLEVVAVFMSLFWLSKWYGNMAVQLAERIQHSGALGMSYQNLAYYEIDRGTFNKAVEHSLRGAEAYRKGGYWNLHGWALTIYFVLSSHLYQGNFTKALTYAQDLVRFGEDANDSQMLVWGLAGLGLAQDRKGDFGKAIVNLRKSIELAEAVPDHRIRAIAGGELGRCYLRQGDLGQALAILEENDRYRAKYKMKRYFPGLRNGLVGAYLLAAERTDQNEKRNWLKKAGRSCREALGQAKKYRNGLAEAMRLQGTYEWLKGRSSSAQKWWQRSLDVAEELGMQYELGITHLGMGQRLRDRKHLEQPEVIFTEIGAGWDLVQTRKLLRVCDALSNS